MNEQKPQQYSVTVTKKEQVTKSVILFTFQLPGGQTMHYTAGQYAVFIIDEKTRRQYSFCSAPGDPTMFDVVIDTAPMGPGSKFFLAKNVGDTALCMAPLGTFVLDKTTDRKKILIATGTGIAPLRSMIFDYLDAGGTDDTTLYWGMRHEEDLYWVSELQELSAKHPNFRFILTLSKPGGSWQGTKGRVTDHVVQEEQNLAGSDFYLCGNRMMISDIEKQLRERNVPLAQIHKEMYF